MKIGPKIALFYSLITMCAIIMVMSVFYLFSSRYINRLYESYLREKAFITAQKYWEKDEVDEQSYRLIQQKYDELLPQAREVLLNMDTLAHVKDTLGKYLNASQQERLFHGDGTPVTFKYKKELGAALYYPDNEGYFIVFVFSENTYGKEIQEHILLLSVTLVVISSIFIFFIGRVYSNRILTPLQHILKELKRIRANNLNVRLRSYGNKDELDQLIVSLNGMLDRIDTAFKSEKSFVSNAALRRSMPRATATGPADARKRAVVGRSADWSSVRVGWCPEVVAIGSNSPKVATLGHFAASRRSNSTMIAGSGFTEIQDADRNIVALGEGLAADGVRRLKFVKMLPSSRLSAMTDSSPASVELIGMSLAVARLRPARKAMMVRSAV